MLMLVGTLVPTLLEDQIIMKITKELLEVNNACFG